ncbi:sorting nexin-22 isoform X2 [Equus asinus]|uniref:sorting nexin-22 isoform X2 n=1 Tax=Equus asinus TaxID=9793 RepID=UPI001D04545E|nr:sorting nexin-22 isoform X2 [Equus asinus]
MLEVHIPSVGPEAEGPRQSPEKSHMIKKLYKVPDFPSKRLPNWRTRGLEQRRQALEAYIQGVLYLNQDVPKELLEFLSLRHFPTDPKASSWSSQLHHRPVISFCVDPYISIPSPAPSFLSIPATPLQQGLMLRVVTAGARELLQAFYTQKNPPWEAGANDPISKTKKLRYRELHGPPARKEQSWNSNQGGLPLKSLPLPTRLSSPGAQAHVVLTGTATLVPHPSTCSCLHILNPVATLFSLKLLCDWVFLHSSLQWILTPCRTKPWSPGQAAAHHSWLLGCAPLPFLQPHLWPSSCHRTELGSHLNLASSLPKFFQPGPDAHLPSRSQGRFLTTVA